MTKIALLIGVGQSEGLKPLDAPVNDVEALKKVLEDSERCGFDEVKCLLNPDPQEMREKIEICFTDRQTNDLILLYFSGHGVKTQQDDKLFLATRKTRKTSQGTLLKSTAVSAQFIHDLMNSCLSKRQLIILDCCYSAAFVDGMSAKDDEVINIKKQLGGTGRAILTSSNDFKPAFEEDNQDLSIYTRYLVEGLETGEADLDFDGNISVDELHNYVEMKVRHNYSNMTPKFYPVEQGFRIILAQVNHNPLVSYRKIIENSAHQVSGRLESIRPQLEQKREELGITLEDARQIEQEILRPYQEKERHKQQFKEEILKFIDLPNITQDEITNLDNLSSLLKLKPEETQKIYNDIKAYLQAKNKLNSLRKLYQLNPNLREVNSYRGEDPLQREYDLLFDLLCIQKDWQEADKQSAKILLIATRQQGSGILEAESIEDILLETLQKIDKFWLEASNHQFGFSIQAELFSYFNQDIDEMAIFCQWKNKDAFFWKGWEEIKFEVSDNLGHLPWLAWKNLGNNPNYFGTFWGITNTTGRVPFYQKLIDWGMGKNLSENAENKDAEYYCKRGKIKRNMGEVTEAIELLNYAIEINPNYGEAYYERGIAYAKIDNNEQASLDYEKALDYVYENYIITDITHRQAEILYQLGYKKNTETKYQEAIVDLEQVIQFNHNFIDAYEQLAIAHFCLNLWDKAIELYTKVIEFKPYYIYGYNNRGSAWLNLDNYQKAIEDYNQAIELGANDNYPYYRRGLCHYYLKNYEVAINDFTKMFETKPDDEDAYRLRGLCHYYLKNYQQAIEDFTKEIEVANDRDKINAYFRRGNAYLDSDRFPESLQDYIYVIEKKPDHYQSYRNIGVANYHLKEYELAIKAFDKAITLNSDGEKTWYYDIYLRKGNTFLDWEKYQEAIDTYGIIIELDSVESLKTVSVTQAYGNRGLAYYSLKDYQKAIPDLTEALKLDEQYTDAYWNRGNAYLYLKDYQKAIVDYKKVIELVPEFPPVFVQQGYAYQRLCNYQEALQSYEAALNLKPDYEQSWYVDIYFKIANTYHGQLDYSKALLKYQEIIFTLDSQTWNADMNIGLIKYEQEKKASAISYWKEAIEKNPDQLEPKLAIAIAEYTSDDKNKQEKARSEGKNILAKDSNWYNIDFLKQNLWGNQLTSDAEKLFQSFKGN